MIAARIRQIQKQQCVAVGPGNAHFKICSPGVVRRRHGAALHVRPASGCSRASAAPLLQRLLLMLLYIAYLLIKS